MVGAIVGELVGASVGDAVGAAVGWSVGVSVGDSVVGEVVGEFVTHAPVLPSRKPFSHSRHISGGLAAGSTSDTHMK